MGEARRRKAILGERYGKESSVSPSPKYLLEEKQIREDTLKLIAYENRFTIVGDELVEAKFDREYTKEWYVSKLRSYRNSFQVISKMTGNNYLDFIREFIEPVVGENLAVYCVKTGYPLVPVNCKTIQEACGRLGCLFMVGKIRSLIDCAFVYYRWDVSAPCKQFKGDIKEYLLEGSYADSLSRYMRTLGNYNFVKKIDKLVHKGVNPSTAQKLVIDQIRLRLTGEGEIRREAPVSAPTPTSRLFALRRG